VTICPACGGSRSRTSYLGGGRYRDFAYTYLRCLTCGSLFADPMPHEALLAALYSPDYLGEHYAGSLEGGADHPEMAAETACAVRWLAEWKSGARVLDVGCGAGRFLTLAASAGLVPEGYEPVAETAHIAERTTGVCVHTGALEKLAGHYDAIHLADVLEHVPQPIAVLRDAVARLAPGGIVLARGPLENQAHLFHRLIVLSRTARGSVRALPPIETPPYHVALFTAWGWHALLGRAELRPRREEISELRWPAPIGFSARPRALAKTLSRLVSASPVGRRWRFGNRVMTLAARFGE